MPGIEAKLEVLVDPGLPPLMRVLDPEKTKQVALIVRRNELTRFRIQP
jgi:hypothetical protein